MDREPSIRLQHKSINSSECVASVTRPILRGLRGVLVLSTLGLLVYVPTGNAQRDARRDNYYRGMHQQVQRGDYNRYSQDDERRHHHNEGHDSGGIGAGKGALIGGAGGAALGAIFGRSLKGTIIGGAAGAGAGAIGGAIANHDNGHKDRRR